MVIRLQIVLRFLRVIINFHYSHQIPMSMSYLRMVFGISHITFAKLSYFLHQT